MSIFALLRQNWQIVLPVLTGMAAIYLLLPRPKPYPRLWGAAAAAAAVLLSGWLLVHATKSRAETVLFYAFSGIAVVAGGSLVVQRNPAYAALSFALVVLSTCGLFLLQAAPFLMAATVIIYAGAIIVTFLFVLMLAQTEGPADANDRSREPLLSTIAGFFLLGTLLYVLAASYDPASPGGMSGDVRLIDSYVQRAQQAQQVQPKFPTGPAAGTVAAGVPSFGAAAFQASAWFLAGEHEMTQEIVRATDDKPRRVGSDGAGFIENLDELLANKDPVFRDLLASKIRPDWEEGERTGGAEGVATMKRALARLQKHTTEVRAGLWARSGGLHPHRGARLSEFSGPSPAGNVDRDPRGSAPLPAENVASFGRSLFTDYLLAVELGGTLLLAATVGAIAIASRSGGRVL